MSAGISGNDDVSRAGIPAVGRTSMCGRAAMTATPLRMTRNALVMVRDSRPRPWSRNMAADAGVAKLADARDLKSFWAIRPITIKRESFERFRACDGAGAPASDAWTAENATA